MTSLDVHPFTDQGRREYQEDYFYTAPTHRTDIAWLGIVADGMGGEQNGDLASRTGVHALRSGFEAALAAGRPADVALREGTESGHLAVVEAARRVGSAGAMGSTVVAIAIDGSTLHWCSAGDSRLYLFRDGKLVQLSRDFTVGEDMIRGMGEGDWKAEDIASSPQRKALTSFLGTDRWRCDQGSRTLQPGDVLVACTDGVYGTIDSEGISAACAGSTAKDMAETMHQRVLAAAKANQDNATALIVRIGKPHEAKGPRRHVWLAGGAGILVVAAGAGALYPRLSPAPAPGTTAAPAPAPLASGALPSPPVPTPSPSASAAPTVSPPSSAVRPMAPASAPGAAANEALGVLKYLEGQFASGKDTADGVLKRLEDTRGDRERARSTADPKMAAEMDRIASSLFDRAWIRRAQDEWSRARSAKSAERAVELLARMTSDTRKADIPRLSSPNQKVAQDLIRQATAELKRREKALEQKKTPSSQPPASPTGNQVGHGTNPDGRAPTPGSADVTPTTPAAPPAAAPPAPAPEPAPPAAAPPVPQSSVRPHAHPGSQVAFGNGCAETGDGRPGRG